MKIRAALLSLFISSSALSGELVRGATIEEVANTASNLKVFYIKVKGGNGPCANRSIIFPASQAPSPEAYERAFSIALAAAASGKKIRAHNYIDDDCHGAGFIGMFSE
ncbi:hypothetical protein EYS14_05665 [Alteromonadaceae bacterium M269]|nr:hypothetical protein EYS14_05665 [Alteromonadaceae bacterium M269]